MAQKPIDDIGIDIPKKTPLQELIDRLGEKATKANIIAAIRSSVKSNIQARFNSSDFARSAEEPTPPTGETPV
jgi:hypothetical protein